MSTLITASPATNQPPAPHPSIRPSVRRPSKVGDASAADGSVFEQDVDADDGHGDEDQVDVDEGGCACGACMVM